MGTPLLVIGPELGYNSCAWFVSEILRLSGHVLISSWSWSRKLFGGGCSLADLCCFEKRPRRAREALELGGSWVIEIKVALASRLDEDRIKAAPLPSTPLVAGGIVADLKVPHRAL